MSASISHKRPRIRAAASAYARLRKEILARDNWRCQICGCLNNLDVHHLRRRSALGDDSEANLITLCRECHQASHRPAEIQDKCEMKRLVSSNPRPSRFEVGLGNLTSCSQRSQITHTIAINKVPSRLPLGPTVPPDSHAGPDELEFKRRPGGFWPLSATP